MKRRDFLFKASSVVAVSLTGCGGGSSDASPSAASSTTLAAAPQPAPSTPPPVQPSIPWIPSSQGLSTLALHATVTGVLPYLATVYPLQGAMPNGQSIESPEDPSLRASVLSRWPDGSASVVVLAGVTSVTAGQIKQVSLRVGNPSGTALTAARVSQLLTSLGFDFGAVGSATRTDFATPERVWWSNERVICARYRVQIGTDGLEAVVDVHAFASSHAFVEVVIENGRIDTSAPKNLSDKNYTGATVSVNGQTIATVSSASAPNGTHNNFRAWYCSTWIGGDPGLLVTHDAASLQGHPMFWKPARAMRSNYASLYGSEGYTPWSSGRHRASNMAGTGESSREGIGPLTGWDSDYVCSGDRYAAKACIANGLALLTFNINYRDSNTGIPPSSSQLQGRRSGGSGSWVPWPAINYGFDGSKATFESSHQPAAPLVAFLCRPSPVFIEIAQKILVFNHTENTSTGVKLWDQGRARGWRMRNYAIATFLTPEADAAWKTSAKQLIANCIPEATQFQQPWNRLNVIWDYSVGDVEDKSTTRPRYQYCLFFQHYMIFGWHLASSMKLLSSVDQTRFDDALSWICEYATRYVNESAGGEWRLQNYITTVGDSDGKTISMAGDWGSALGSDYIDSPPPNTGGWLFIDHNPSSNANWNKWASATSSSTAGIGYDAKFFTALVIAKERGIPGSAAAWERVIGGISNLQSWADGFSDNPIYNRWPRNA